MIDLFLYGRETRGYPLVRLPDESVPDKSAPVKRAQNIQSKAPQSYAPQLEATWHLLTLFQPPISSSALQLSNYEFFISKHCID